MIREGMPEVQHTPLAAAQKSRTEYRVGAPIQQWTQKLGVLIRVVFEIGVLDDAEFPARFPDRPANGGSLTLIGYGLQQANYAWVFLRDGFHFLHGGIR